MTKFEEMQASYEQMETTRKRARDIVLEAKTSYREELSQITNDRMLSNEGKQIEKEKLNQRYRDIFLGEMMKVKDKATEAADKTIDLATKILLEDPAQPEETKVATFNQKLADLKTSLLLAPNPERGIESLKMFVEETTDPYLAKQLQSEFMKWPPLL